MMETWTEFPQNKGSRHRRAYSGDLGYGGVNKENWKREFACLRDEITSLHATAIPWNNS